MFWECIFKFVKIMVINGLKRGGGTLVGVEKFKLLLKDLRKVQILICSIRYQKEINNFVRKYSNRFALCESTLRQCRSLFNCDSLGRMEPHKWGGGGHSFTYKKFDINFVFLKNSWVRKDNLIQKHPQVVNIQVCLNNDSIGVNFHMQPQLK